MTTKIVRSLKAHEDIIESGLRFFVDVGQSLMAIRDEKLYLDEHETFEEYCKVRWNMSRPHAYRLMGAAEVVDRISILSPIGDTKTKTSSGKSQIAIPENESQARAVADASDDPNVQIKVWKKAVADAPKDDDGKPIITASIIKKAADVVAPKPPKPKPQSKAEPVEVVNVPAKISGGITFDVEEIEAAIEADQEVLANLKDSLGHAVNNGHQDVFKHVTRFTSLISQLGKIVTEVESLVESPAGKLLDIHDFKTQIKQAQTILRFAKPYCPTPPIDHAKDTEQKKRWERCNYLVEMEYRALTDKQKLCLR